MKKNKCYTRGTFLPKCNHITSAQNTLRIQKCHKYIHGI